MTDNHSGNTQLYFKLIEYKRSVGITQWAVFSIFATLSNAILVLSLREASIDAALWIRALALISYWLGFFLYERYRSLNQVVAEYIRTLESDLGFGFQTYLDTHFHPKGFSTRTLLLYAGLLYSVFAVAVSILT